MCGIVGYYGPANPKDVILSGLKALEYRGYDSAGVAIFHKGQLKRVRAEGKLGQLENKLRHEDFQGHLGIGHTRWATHGKPSERNAHPHYVNGVSIVHNGIIENYADLKKQLSAQGAVFESDTDSEVVAHLIAQQLRHTPDLLTTVQTILPKLHGAYAIVVLWEKQPEVMVAFKNGPPLVLGDAGNAVVIASDVQAIVGQTRRVAYLEDHEIVCVKGTEFKFYAQNGKTINKNFVELKWSQDQVQKGGYKHFMLKEIFEQPHAVASALAPYIELNLHQIQLNKDNLGISPQQLSRYERIFMVACGTSYYASLIGEYVLERLVGIPVECDLASEFRYRHPVVPKDSLFIAISQSGETADTLAAVRLAKEQGAHVLSICNVPNSSIDREANGHIYMNAGVEIGVASTKAFTATLSLLNVLAIGMAKLKSRLNAAEERQLVEELQAVPAQMETVLAYDKFFKTGAEHLKNYKGFLFMGRGVSYPIALEGALKVKELAYMHAEGYAAGEMKHGPLALIDERMAVVMLVPSDDLFEKTLSNLQEAKARGGKILALGTGQNALLREVSEYYLALPKSSWLIQPLLEVIPLQLMAYHVADSLGHDVDQPRNLAKSVTVE